MKRRPQERVVRFLRLQSRARSEWINIPQLRGNDPRRWLACSRTWTIRIAGGKCGLEVMSGNKVAGSVGGPNTLMRRLIDLILMFCH